MVGMACICQKGCDFLLLLEKTEQTTPTSGTMRKRKRKTPLSGAVATPISALLAVMRRNPIGGDIVTGDAAEFAALCSQCQVIDLEHLTEYIADLARSWRHRNEAEREGKARHSSGWRARLGGERRTAA